MLLVPSGGWGGGAPHPVSADGAPGPRYRIRSSKFGSEAILILPQVPLMLSAKKQHCITSERHRAIAQASLQS